MDEQRLNTIAIAIESAVNSTFVEEVKNPDNVRIQEQLDKLKLYDLELGVFTETAIREAAQVVVSSLAFEDAAISFDEEATRYADAFLAQGRELELLSSEFADSACFWSDEVYELEDKLKASEKLSWQRYGEMLQAQSEAAELRAKLEELEDLLGRP